MDTLGGYSKPKRCRLGQLEPGFLCLHQLLKQATISTPWSDSEIAADGVVSVHAPHDKYCKSGASSSL